MGKAATFGQASNILTLVQEQGLDLEQIQDLRPYITALAKSRRDNRLPDIRDFRALTEGWAKVQVSEFCIDFDVYPGAIPIGYTILPDAKQLPNRVRGKVSISFDTIDLYWDKDQESGPITGNDMLVRLKNQPVYGAQLLDFLLENQSLIPKEWKNGPVVFFWGTLYQYAGDVPCVRCLHWSLGTWRDRYISLRGRQFNKWNPAVVLGKGKE